MKIIRNILITIIVIITIMFPVQSLSQVKFDIPVSLPSGLEPAISVSVGNVSKIEGILFPMKTATVLFAEIEYQFKKQALDMETLEKRLTEKFDFEDKLSQEKHQFEIELMKEKYDFMSSTYESRQSYLEERLSSCEDNLSTDSGFDWDVFYFIGGVVLGAATAVGIFYAVN